MESNLTMLGRFRLERSMIEVTSLHRPDPSWKKTDTHGHEHRWYVKEEILGYRSPITSTAYCVTCVRVHQPWDTKLAQPPIYDTHETCVWCGRSLHRQPASGYSPTHTYETPSLLWVQEGFYHYEDDDGVGTPYGHHECIQCHERLEPGFIADSTTQYVPGLMRCYVDGRSVSKEEFAREWLAAGGALPKGWV